MWLIKWSNKWLLKKLLPSKQDNTQWQCTRTTKTNKKTILRGYIDNANMKNENNTNNKIMQIQRIHLYVREKENRTKSCGE